MKDCIVLTGGGTAGHTTLNIKLKDELKKHFKQIIYIGSKNGIEKQLILNSTDYKYYSITTTKLRRKKILSNLSVPFKLSKGIKEAKKILQEYKPSVVFSKGGYVGLPVTIAAHKLSIPVVCHESDLSMGLANKLAKKYASVVCTNFEKTTNYDKKKCKYTGMPLKIAPFSRENAKKMLKIDSSKPVLLVTGGSLGAVALNKFIFENLDEILKDFFVIHLTGKGNLNEKIKRIYYIQFEFYNDMPLLLRASDFALSRAGANTCIELLSNKILTIFIPLPSANSRGDQIENANYLKSKNLCSVIYQNDLSIQSFKNEITYLFNNKQKILDSISDAKIENGTDKIMSIILQNCK